MQKKKSTKKELLKENEELKSRVEELEETFRAIRHDEVDALIINTTQGDRVFTLRGADESYRILIEQMKEGAALLSDDSTVLYSNSSLANLLNKPLQKIICCNIQQHVAPIHVQVFERLLEESKKNEKTNSKEITLLKSDGTPIPTIMSINRIEVQGTEATYTVVTDLTYHMEEEVKRYTKRLETEINEKTKALQTAERMATIGQTAGMVGHDIRNPLQAITSDVYLLKDYLIDMPDMPMKNDVAESLDGIEENVAYINKIVSDLQDYAKPLKPVGKRTNIKTLIKDTIKTIDIAPEITVSYDIEDNAGTVFADPALLKRILDNLITNALQAMPNGGKLNVAATKQTNNIMISVEDSGVGIPDEIKSKLFTPMFTTKSKGQGFGLAVVKRMTEALGGTITFESEVGKGTKFIIGLPEQ